MEEVKVGEHETNIVFDKPDPAAELQEVPQPVIPVVSGPMRLIEMAVQRGASVDELDRLMGLVERHEANEARKAYVAAMARFKQDPPRIEKNREADVRSKREGAASFAYKYANLADVCGAIVGGLAKYGISHRWSTKQADGHVAVTCTLTHEFGHSESTMLSAGLDLSGGKNNIQALGSTVSYLERYTLLAACGIAVDDGQDDDGAGVSQEDRQALRQDAREMRAGSRGRAKPADVAAERAGKGKPADGALLARAQAEADKGHMAFGAFWKGATDGERRALSADLEALQQRASTARSA